MPPRVTRSSARLAADTSSTTSDPPPLLHHPVPPSAHSRSQTGSRKRKAAPPEASPADEAPSPRKTKKAKHTEPDTVVAPPPTLPRSRRGNKASQPAMSSAGHDEGDNTRRSANRRRPSSGTSADTSPHALSSATSRRRSSRKKASQAPPVPSSSSATKRTRKPIPKKESGTSGLPIPANNESEPDLDNSDDHDDSDEPSDEEEEEASRHNQEGQTGTVDDDPFTNSLFGRAGGAAGLTSTLQALSDMMSGMTARLRRILDNLRAKDDPSVQLIALSELSEILLVSNEDDLAGHFSPDQIVKELVALMQPNDFGEENPEVMLLACRCIANLMEALPTATASVVYGGAVPVLCQKLLEIHYIDLAEQALSTLEKISVEFPSSIVREGGLTACLTYLDFFATSTQRTAVTTAANCCRNIPEASFPVVRDVMPILLNVLGSNDQKVVEQASLCVSRVIESFKYQDEKLEELVSPDLLKAILRLLLPGSTNMIGHAIHTQFLRVLAITARASPRLSMELLRMNVVDTLYQILTGVSPPAGVEDMAARIDKNIIMQALIRTPRDQVFETLNVICELLPAVSDDDLMFLDDLNDAGYTGSGTASMATRSRKSPNDKRLELLQTCQDEVRRFAVILIPTLMHAYTSTVNLSVRQKVLTAQLKMLSNFDTAVIKDALRGVAYASHLASIMSQEENPMLVTFALQAAELLLKRLESIYRPQFYREGVMAETARLSLRKIAHLPERPLPSKDLLDEAKSSPAAEEHVEADRSEVDDQDPEDRESDGEDHEINEDDEDEAEDDDSEASSKAESIHGDAAASVDVQDIITNRARKFMEVYGQQDDSSMEGQASQVEHDLNTLVHDLRSCYGAGSRSDGSELFKRLSEYFDTDSADGITSYELLNSGVVDALLQIFTDDGTHSSSDARSAFLVAFMSATGGAKIAKSSNDSPLTAFSVLVHKLQDLLSRTEHFEVITVHQHAFDSNRSSAASMLAKQLRIRLAADDDSGIPAAYRNIMVSIHAIATFRALDDYLRPRISLAERARTREVAASQLTEAATPPSLVSKAGVTATPTPTLGLSDAANSLLSRSGSPKTASKVESATKANKEEATTARLRRSSRKLSSRHSHNEEAADEQGQLECADEAQLSDEEGDEAVEAALDAIVDDLEDEMEAETPDSPAVNLEIANTGKVTARKEDGTRVNTPLQNTPSLGSLTSMSRLSASARLAAARELLSGPNSRMSYASALQAVPQDWHIEFSVNGQPLPNDTTIYRAVHFNQSNSDDVSNRNVWSALHKITFKRVQGPPPAEASSLMPSPEAQSVAGPGLPPSLNQHPQTASILQLMSILHDMNANLDDVLSVDHKAVKLNAEPLGQFVNTKLTAKLNRQLEEPLIVASNCLPSWSEDLARLYPFLFPFETRHLFLQSTSFGYSRSMTRWQNAQSESESRHSRRRDERPFLGRLQRQKVRISRSRILESALKVMELYGSSPSILEVEYFEEVGTGLGPTLEFYSTISREFSKKKIKLWRENESGGSGEYAFGSRGLFPAPMSDADAKNDNGKRILNTFKLLGKFVARSMLDSRIIDISFNPTFFRIGDGQAAVPLPLGAVASVDWDLANSLKDLVQAAIAKRAIDQNSHMSIAEKAQAAKQILIKGATVEDLGLDFTLPGYPSIELQPNGANINVTIDNVGHYVKSVVDFTLSSGVQKQVDAFRAGFSQVFPYSALKAFTPDELVMLFGRTEEDWSLETLMDSIKADHGYNLDSQSVRNLLQTMSEYGPQSRRDFLQFVTGSPKLPIGGFKSLTPMFTVVCKPAEPPYTSDAYLPSVMTCVNYLKMPDYSSLESLQAKLNMAIREGQGAFHLS